MRLIALLLCGCSGGGDFVVVSLSGLPDGATKIVANSVLDGKPAQSPEVFDGSFSGSTSFALKMPAEGRLTVGVEAWVGDCVAAYQSGEVRVSARADLALSLDAITPCDPHFDRSPDMVAVPAGVFSMGCSGGDCFPDEAPVGQVTLNAFQIDRYETTTSEFSGHGDQLPVDVTWEQAKSYCEGRGKRLPTEAEWEKAARGTDGRRYPWGKGPLDCQHTNYLGCSSNHLEPVGSHPDGVSPYGAFDMAGNIGEWVADWYADGYPAGPRSNPTGPSSGTKKVVRGGDFLSGDVFLSTTVRGSVAPTESLFTGIRCAR